MNPLGWIFFQSNHIADAPSRADCCQHWDLKFNRDFNCSNIVVSDSRYRQSACSLLASEKSAAFHLGVSAQQLNGYSTYSTVLNQGWLILIFEQPQSPSSAAVIEFFNNRILPFTLQCSDAIELNERTKVVVKLTALGFTTKEVAKALFLTNRGVDYHLDLAKKSLGASNKSALVFLAMQQRWFS